MYLTVLVLVLLQIIMSEYYWVSICKQWLRSTVSFLCKDCSAKEIYDHMVAIYTEIVHCHGLQ